MLKLQAISEKSAKTVWQEEEEESAMI